LASSSTKTTRESSSGLRVNHSQGIGEPVEFRLGW